MPGFAQKGGSNCNLVNAQIYTFFGGWGFPYTLSHKQTKASYTLLHNTHGRLLPMPFAWCLVGPCNKTIIKTSISSLVESLFLWLNNTFLHTQGTIFWQIPSESSSLGALPGSSFRLTNDMKSRDACPAPPRRKAGCPAGPHRFWQNPPDWPRFSDSDWPIAVNTAWAAKEQRQTF